MVLLVPLVPLFDTGYLLGEYGIVLNLGVDSPDQLLFLLVQQLYFLKQLFLFLLGPFCLLENRLQIIRFPIPLHLIVRYALLKHSWIGFVCPYRKVVVVDSWGTVLVIGKYFGERIAGLSMIFPIWLGSLFLDKMFLVLVSLLFMICLDLPFLDIISFDVDEHLLLDQTKRVQTCLDALVVLYLL